MKDALKGLDKIMIDQIPKGHIVLIVGEPGSLKSTLAYIFGGMLIQNTEKTGVYVTLEQTSQSLLENTKSLGIKILDNMVISDLASFMMDIDVDGMEVVNQDEFYDLVMENLFRPIRQYKSNAQRRPMVFILDSINALSSLVTSSQANIRKNLQSILFKMKASGITCFLIMEIGKGEHYQPEYFMSDGIIEVGVRCSQKGKMQRYIQVRKMRSVHHSIQPFLIETTDEGLRIISELL